MDDNYTTCTISHHVFCVNQIHEHQIECTCPVACNDISYNMNIVYDGIHEHNVDQLQMIGVPIDTGPCCETQKNAQIKVTTTMVVLEESEFELQEKADITPTQVPFNIMAEGKQRRRVPSLFPT